MPIAARTAFSRSRVTPVAAPMLAVQIVSIILFRLDKWDIFLRVSLCFNVKTAITALFFEKKKKTFEIKTAKEREPSFFLHQLSLTIMLCVRQTVYCTEMAGSTFSYCVYCQPEKMKCKHGSDGASLEFKVFIRGKLEKCFQIRKNI